MISTLDDIKVGENASIYKLNSTGNIRRRFLDIGLIENTTVKCVGENASKNMKAFLIRGAVIAIRTDDLKDILIK